MIDTKELIPVIIYTTIAFLLLVGVLILFFYFSRKKIIKNVIEKKEQEIQFQKKIVQAHISAQEDERYRIAQELHDDISSKLSIISLNTHLLSNPKISEEEALQLQNTIINQTSKAMDSSRRIAHNLLPPTLERLGLQIAVEELCSEYNATKQILIKYSNSIYFVNTEKQKHLHIYRILQELINNSIKHGKATEIFITFEGQDNKNCCNYADNGKGFDSETLMSKKGLGMNNIYNRIALINGHIDIKTKKKKGVNIQFSF